MFALLLSLSVLFLLRGAGWAFAFGGLGPEVDVGFCGVLIDGGQFFLCELQIVDGGCAVDHLLLTACADQC